MSNEMDTPIERTWLRRHQRWLLGGATVLASALAIASLTFNSASRTLRVPRDTVTLATVERGVYHDFIPLRARVVPRETVFLDALEGGRVDRVHVEPGDLVTAGQVLVELSNTTLELDVLDREARLIESITQLQTYQTQLEQNRLNNEKALALIDYNIKRLRRSVERRSRLATGGVESREIAENAQDELEYTLRLRPIQAQSNTQQDALRVRQLPQIEAQLEKLLKDVEITRSKLDNLSVRAPVAGRVTAIDLTIGQNLNRGERLAEITPDSGSKLSAPIDEFYLGRLQAGQGATVQIGGQEATLRVTRVYPQVKDGTFTVDLAFDGATPQGLLPGQAVQGRLALGNDVPALLIPADAWLERTGGDWILVLDANGESAHRRQIDTGRRNADQVEVLSGLQPGERVIVSDYAGFERVDRVDLND